jgi:hypothetical protein
MINERDNRKASRREMLRTAGRWCGLAAVTAVAGWLIGRRGATGGESRDGGGPCRTCPAMMRCRLPQADAARRRGIALAGPVRSPMPGREADAVPHCAEGRRLAAREQT